MVSTPHRKQQTSVSRGVGRALDLLELIAITNPGVSLTEAAAEVSLTPATVSRHLKALAERGYVLRDEDGKYWPASFLAKLAVNTRKDADIETLLSRAQPTLEQLAVDTGESCYLAVCLEENEAASNADSAEYATYFARAFGPSALRHVAEIGQRIPLENSALGVALDQLGTVVIRQGAVEEGITAICLGVDLSGTAICSDLNTNMRSAVSIVGPSERINASDSKNLKTISKLLEEAVSSIENSMGVIQ